MKTHGEYRKPIQNKKILKKNSYLIFTKIIAFYHNYPSYEVKLSESF